MRKATLLTLFGVSATMAIQGHAQTRVSTVPTSRDIVVLELVIGQAAPARVVSLNGGLIRLAIRTGPTLALIPALRNNAVAVTVMEIVTNPRTGSETVRQLAKANVALGASVRCDDVRFLLEIGLVEIKQPVSSVMVQLANPCTICCVTCGDLTACACAVEMECGKCCCPAGGCGCECEGRPSSEGVSHSAANGCAAKMVKRQPN